MVWYVFRNLLIGVCFANLVLWVYHAFGVPYSLSASIIIIFTLLFLFHGVSYEAATGSLDLKAFKNYIRHLQKKQQEFCIINLYLKKDLVNEDITFA